MTQRDAQIAWGWSLWTIAAVWPTIAGALSWAKFSPYERALAQSWCGVSPHEALGLLGHCAPCWAGAAALALAGAVLLRRAPHAWFTPSREAAALEPAGAYLRSAGQPA